jgi:hypothetical protein
LERRQERPCRVRPGEGRRYRGTEEKGCSFPSTGGVNAARRGEQAELQTQ